MSLQSLSRAHQGSVLTVGASAVFKISQLSGSTGPGVAAGLHIEGKGCLPASAQLCPGAGSSLALPAALQSRVWLCLDRGQHLDLTLVEKIKSGIGAASPPPEPFSLYCGHLPGMQRAHDPTRVYWGLKLRGLWERILQPSLQPSSAFWPVTGWSGAG